MWRSILATTLLLLLWGCSPPTAEDKAAAFVTKMGGMVSREESLPGNPVTGVHLRERPVTDADLKELAPLTNLRSLNLSRTQVTDAGMKELAQFKSLRSLGIRETQITDAGLKEISKIPTLASLYMGGAQVTDTGLNEFLKALPNCEISK